VDTLYVAEMTEITTAGNEHDQYAQAELLALGYRGKTSEYSDVDGVRNAHTMSVWTRLPGSEIVQHRLGDRFALGVRLGDLAVVGAHFPDNSEAARLPVAKDAAELRHQTLKMILMGDFNAMYRDDAKAGVARAGGRVGRAMGMRVKDYYNMASPFQRAVGKALRSSDMGVGETMAILERAGLHDADPAHQPTVHQHGLSFAIDHILGSSGVTLTDFTLHGRSVRGGKPLSDHNPLSATARY
jgi:endonuclease/exonuclease/phosphatase family metal-dependent hydrolase